MNRLSRLSLTGFKSIRAMDLELGALNVLIGPNGAGKSNFLSFIQMLSALAQGRLSRFVAQEGGANMLLHHGRKRTPEITVKVSVTDGQGDMAYGVTFGGAPPDTLFLEGEAITRTSADEVRTPSSQGERPAFASSVLTQSPGADEQALARIFSGLTHYHFHDTSEEAPIRQRCQIDDNRSLRENGGNLAAFLYLLRHTRPEHYESIRNTIRLATPFFDDFVLEPNALDPKTIQLEWREQGSDMLFFAHHLSDGTLRFIALATALLQPELPLILALDEPELGATPLRGHAPGLHDPLGVQESADHPRDTVRDAARRARRAGGGDRRGAQELGARGFGVDVPPPRLRSAEGVARGVHARRALGEERPRGPPLKRILVLVEGQTEETFVNRVLAPHLWSLGKAPEVTRVATRRVQGRRAFRGGIPVYAKVEGDVRRLLASSPDAVTTLFDYYALPDDFPGTKTMPSGASCFARAAHLEQAFASAIGDRRFIPQPGAPRVRGAPLRRAGRHRRRLARSGTRGRARRHRGTSRVPRGDKRRARDAPVPAHRACLSGLPEGPARAPDRRADRCGRDRAKCRHFHAWLTRSRSFDRGEVKGHDGGLPDTPGNALRSPLGTTIPRSPSGPTTRLRTASAKTAS